MNDVYVNDLILEGVDVFSIGFVIERTILIMYLSQY